MRKSSVKLQAQPSGTWHFSALSSVQGWRPARAGHVCSALHWQGLAMSCVRVETAHCIIPSWDITCLQPNFFFRLPSSFFYFPPLSQNFPHEMLNPLILNSTHYFEPVSTIFSTSEASRAPLYLRGLRNSEAPAMSSSPTSSLSPPPLCRWTSSLNAINTRASSDKWLAMRYAPLLSLISIRRRFLWDPNDNRTLLLMTDGACLDNGQVDPKAGWAFYQGESLDGQPLVVSGRLEDQGPWGDAGLQTSNRAELRAVIAASRFRFWLGEGFTTVVFATDSSYVVDGATLPGSRTDGRRATARTSRTRTCGSFCLESASAGRAVGLESSSGRSPGSGTLSPTKVPRRARP